MNTKEENGFNFLVNRKCGKRRIGKLIRSGMRRIIVNFNEIISKSS